MQRMEHACPPYADGMRGEPDEQEIDQQEARKQGQGSGGEEQQVIHANCLMRGVWRKEFADLDKMHRRFCGSAR
jgi:hypothetical protein